MEAYDDPAFKNLMPLETLKMIVQRYPGAAQFKREEHVQMGLAFDINMGCVNLGNVTRLMLLPSYTSGMRARLRGREKAKCSVYMNYLPAAVPHPSLEEGADVDRVLRRAVLR